MRLELMSLHKKVSPLAAYASNVTSQHGEDGLIAHIMKVIQPSEKYCVEFGAWDGKYLSNCHTLLTAGGWGGAMIEANAGKFAELTETYRGFPAVKTINRLVDFEGPNSLDAILVEAGAPRSFGLLSIDVDGNDYHIWNSLSAFTPELVVIEFNPTIPNDVLFVQDASFDVNHGASLLALVVLGKEKGYELAATTQTNGLFVRADKFPLLGIQNNFIERMHTPVLNGRIFQGYDGSIHVVGMDRLWERGTPLSSEDFQVLPKDQQVFADAQKNRS
jgi:hypothetical protein